MLFCGNFSCHFSSSAPFPFCYPHSPQPTPCPLFQRPFPSSLQPPLSQLLSEVWQGCPPGTCLLCPPRSVCPLSSQVKRGSRVPAAPTPPPVPRGCASDHSSIWSGSTLRRTLWSEEAFPESHWPLHLYLSPLSSLVTVLSHSKENWV